MDCLLEFSFIYERNINADGRFLHDSFVYSVSLELLPPRSLWTAAALPSQTSEFTRFVHDTQMLSCYTLIVGIKRLNRGRRSPVPRSSGSAVRCCHVTMLYPLTWNLWRPFEGSELAAMFQMVMKE